MSDSDFSNAVTAESPAAPLPMPPVINSVSFKKLVATLNITLAAANTDGDAVPGLSNIKVFFGPDGTDITAVTPVEFPGAYTPGQVVDVQVSVPAYGVVYRFEAKDSD